MLHLDKSRGPYLVTAIADRTMAHVTPRSAELGGQGIKNRVFGSGFKSVAGMMTMLEANVTWYAKVVVLTDGACNKSCLVENYTNQH